ncbi:hypothetical protein BZL39_M05180 [Zygosaccharomyces parabailii]|nr:hypothetical protein BZL39_M05180 [Zygosaccharomyces parabailii]
MHMQPAGEIAYTDRIRIHPSRIVRTPTPLPTVQAVPGPGKSKTHADETNGGVTLTHTPRLLSQPCYCTWALWGRRKPAVKQRPYSSANFVFVIAHRRKTAVADSLPPLYFCLWHPVPEPHSGARVPRTNLPPEQLLQTPSLRVPPRPPTSPHVQVRCVAASRRFLRSIRRVTLAMQKKKSGEKGTRRTSLGASATPASPCSSKHGKTNSARSSFFCFLLLGYCRRW